MSRSFDHHLLLLLLKAGTGNKSFSCAHPFVRFVIKRTVKKNGLLEKAAVTVYCVI